MLNLMNRPDDAHGGYSPPPAFPEPQIYRTVSSRPIPESPATAPVNGGLIHRYSKSDNGSHTRLHHNQSALSLASTSTDYYATDDNYSNESYETDEFSTELSSLSLASEQGIAQFQEGRLSEKDQEWHRLVPPEAIQALGDKEVQRQSVIFEVFKAERDYVSDLQAIRDVYIEPLRTAHPPIIAPNLIQGFIAEVFGNLNQIIAHHERMLGALFARQREQHPLVQSIADIVLDTVLKSDFRSGYETYIKHYPLSESHHRNQLKRNPAYQNFVQSVSNDPRIRKRDLITFLSRPVTRLPRLNLLLSQILKLTEKDHEHPDLETLPIILEVLSSCIKSTQPGIEAAESKVKFWEMCESLVYQKGEIMDLDLYDQSRTLVYSGPVFRRARQESGFSGWSELTAGLLDNYFILTREETRPNGVIKRYLVSRPLHLSFLRLGPFDGPPETRREKAENGVLSSLRHQNVPIYPFTIYHSANSITRRYTLCAPSESARDKWKNALVDALGVHKARQEGNMYFDPRNLTDHFFRTWGPKAVNSSPMTGKISCAATFFSGGRSFIAVGCNSGVFVAPRGSERFEKVLPHINPTSMATIHASGPKIFNKFLIHVGTSLFAYSLDLMARMALGQSDQKTVDGSMEKVAGHDVIFFRHAIVGSRALLIYASKKLLQVTLSLHVLEILDISEATMSPRRTDKASKAAPGFRKFGDSGYIPKDAYDLTPLVKTIGVCTHDGIVILDPLNLANSAVSVVPDFQGTPANNPKASLKARVDAGAKPLGLIRCSASELLVVYDVLGCYITKHGIPSRQSGFIKWEAQATSYAHRGGHVLLFSRQFIEIRHVATGRLVQIIDGLEIRLLYTPTTTNSDDTILVAMRGEKDDKDGISEKIVQLVETSELPVTSAESQVPSSAIPAEVWEEWDM